MLKPFMSLLGVMALMFVTAPPNVAATRAWLLENVFAESHSQSAPQTPSAPRVASLQVTAGALGAVQASTSW